MYKRKKILAAALAATMLFSVLVGCTDKGDGGTGANATVNKETSDAKKEYALIKYKSYAGPSDSDTAFKNTVVGKEIKKAINVELEFLPSSSNATDIITDFASDSIPDFFVATTSPVNYMQLGQVNKAANENVLADMAPYLDNYPTLKAVFDTKLPAFSDFVVNNPDFKGKKYILPSSYTMSENPWLSGWGLYIRDDVAKKHNVALPKNFKTTDELYNLLKTIKSGNHKDIVGKNMYPLGFLQPWPQAMAALTRPFDFGGTMRIGEKDGKITHMIDTPFVDQQISWVRKLLAEGLLDPESFTQKQQQGDEKMKQAKYGVTALFAITAVEENEPNKTLLSVAPQMQYKPMGNLANNKGEELMTVNRGMEATQIYAISKKANVKGVLRFLEYVNSEEGRLLVTLGRNEQEWDFNEKGFAEMKKDVYQKLKTDPNFYNEMGIGNLTWFTLITGRYNPETNYFGADETTPTYQSDPSYFNRIQKTVQTMMPKVKVVDKLNIDLLLQTYPQKEQITAPLSEYNDILIRCYVEKTDASATALLNGYRKTLKDNGLDDYIKYLQKEHTANKDKYATYVTDVQ